ncbi:MAG: FG-GAP repeat protein [Chitinophagaceae bacterium]|nr:FG-GAP repeat protein [Chitinophagaceae bacterium]
MFRKILLSCIIVFPCIITGDIIPSLESKLPAPVFNFTKANHPGKKARATISPFWETAKKNNTIDTAALKQGNWYADAIRNIEVSEYEINKDDITGVYCGPNRKQRLRSFFNYNSFTLQPSSETQDWTLKMQLSGIYADKKLVARPEENDLPVIGSNKIVFNNQNFTTEYVNNKDGIRQNFVIQKEPASKPQSINIKLQTGKGWYINKVHDKELHFAKREGEQLSKKITYNSLKVWDANNKELTAKFAVNKKHSAFEIEVNTVNAVYPITIDPLSTGSAGTPDWIGDDADQTNAYYGFSVASAGDVNGDGYSDVIIGARGFDGAFTDEGRAFVYHGSATGLSSTPLIIPYVANEANAYFGESVSSAGDVNGDGYSDVIIGAFGSRYLGNPLYPGRAFVYHGSASSLSTFPDWIGVDSDQSATDYGGSVACAGDVNGDGYSDVIIGAEYYKDGTNAAEGRAFVYHGSASGLSAIPNSTPDDANLPNAHFGVSVAGAGDVNGDGFSDVIIGAHLYNDNLPYFKEGRVFAYYGSASGLSSSPNWFRDDADQDQSGFGISVASAGDVNGDGYSDVIIGAYGYDDGPFGSEGRAFVYHGSAGGLSTIPNSVLDDADQSLAYSGFSVASVGDVNGDGYSDVMMGAYLYNDGANNDEGRAFLYYGSSTGLSATPKCILDDADLAGAKFGWSVASAGDVNGDGYSDVIIGAPFYNDGPNTIEGRAFVYHGSPSGLSAVPNNTPDDANQIDASFGWSVASAGDVNGDGYSDVIIGAPDYDDGANTDEGRAFIYHGSAMGLSASPNSTPDDADQAGAKFGISVACAGDVNGDGYSDVIIGAYSYDDGANLNEGRAFVYFGSAGGLSASPNNTPDDADQANANFGYSVAGAGDVNGDGYSDVIIGAWRYNDGANTQEGRAFVYYGSVTGLSASPDNSPDDANQAFAYFGYSVAGAGDINGDGYSDVIIGAYGFNDGANGQEGRAFIYHGSSSGLSANPNNTPDDADQPGANFGWSVAAAGDVNGDGFSDVIIGAPYYNDGINDDEGRAFVYHGSAAGLSATPNSTPDDADQDLASFGISVASAGDVNGDGYSDVIIGAFLYDDGANADEGRAFVYYGSSSGLSATPGDIQDDANQANSDFGFSVAGAGDVNGDGFSDVIIGAYSYDDGTNTNEGRAFVYYGNNGGGLRNNRAFIIPTL